MTELTKDEILKRVRPFVYMNGSHEMPDYVAIWNAAVAYGHATAQVAVHGAEIDGYSIPEAAPFADEVKVHRTRQLDGSVKWAVRYRGVCLNKQGTWEWEPMPSSRDDEFLARCRFDLAQEAIGAALAAGRPE